MFNSHRKSVLLVLLASAPSAFALNVIDLDSSTYRSLVATGNDWTPAIVQAIADLPSTGGTIVFPAGEQMYQSAMIQVSNKSHFIIDGNGSTLKYVNGAAVANGYGSFYFHNDTQYVFKNLTIDGNRNLRTPAEVYAHSVIVDGGSDYTLENIHVIGAVVDGFYIASPSPTVAASYPTHGTLLNCSSDDAYRQGLSVINAFGLDIIGGYYSNTNGTAPEAGIDIESNPGSNFFSSRNIRIEGVTFEDNNGQGLLIASALQPKDISVRDSHFSGDKLGAIYVSGGDVTISGNSFADFDQATGGIVTVDSVVGATRVSITDNHFRDITAAFPAISLKGQDTVGDVVITGNTFENVNSALSTYKKHVIFSNNIVSSVNAATAAVALQTSDAVVSNNIFRNTQRYAIWVGGTYNRIIGNTITDHTFPDSQNWGVIRITNGDAGHNEVRNNSIRTSGEASSYRGIRVDFTSAGAGDAADAIIYFDNRCPGYLGGTDINCAYY